MKFRSKINAIENVQPSLKRGFFLLFFTVFSLSLVTPAYEAIAAGERSIIRTGEALSRSILIQEVNITRTRRDVDVNILREETVSVSTSNVAEVETSVISIANTGGNSTNKGNNETPTKTISLRELGLLQLAAHDFFNVDRDTEIDHENGKLDLSTLLDQGDEYIAVGGEPRNRENVILFSVAKEYGEKYLYLLERGNTQEQARSKLLRKYHRELGEIYDDLFDEDMPEPQEGDATLTENLALRTIHDFLPGIIEVDGVMISPVDASLIGTTLTKKELQQRSSPLDGVIDAAFLDIEILIPPATILHISLLERDSSFATQFGTDHSFEYFMSELENGSYNHQDLVYQYIEQLFAKGLHF